MRRVSAFSVSAPAEFVTGVLSLGPHTNYRRGLSVRLRSNVDEFRCFACAGGGGGGGGDESGSPVHPFSMPIFVTACFYLCGVSELSISDPVVCGSILH